jgi:hypothetical protein
VTPFVAKALALLDERNAATTPEAKRDAEERLAALIRANVNGRTWTADNRLKQTGERE